MKQIRFSDVGVVVNSMEEVDEIYLMYTALGIHLDDTFKDQCKNDHSNIEDWFIQTTAKDIITTLIDGADLRISLVDYPIEYSMDSLDFAVACQLLQSNKTDELITHLNKHCKEYE